MGCDEAPIILTDFVGCHDNDLGREDRDNV